MAAAIHHSGYFTAKRLEGVFRVLVLSELHDQSRCCTIRDVTDEGFFF